MKKYIIFILLLLNSNLLFSANKKAFFLCVDKKIYIIDLKKYSITNSESIPTLGKPTYVDIKKNIAYIGNERGYSEKSYFPLILVNLSNFKIMDTHNIVKDEKPHAIYFVKVSKKYDSLIYIGYAHPNYNKGDIIYDVKDRQIIGSLNFFLSENTFYSKNENYAFAYITGGSKRIKRNNQIRDESWNRFVHVYNIKEKKIEERIEDKKTKQLNEKVKFYNLFNRKEPYLYYLKYYFLGRWSDHPPPFLVSAA